MMDRTKMRKVAAAAIAAVGAIHLVLAPEYFGEQAYVGILFLCGAAASAVIAGRLWIADHTPAWIAGAAVSLGMGAGFVLSRTVGLPGFHESEWELSGIVSLLLEAGFLALAFAGIRRFLLVRQPLTR